MFEANTHPHSVFESSTHPHRYTHPEIAEVVSEQTDSVLIAELALTVRELKDSHDRILALLAEITAEVGPTIEALKSSPILKMMGVK